MVVEAVGGWISGSLALLADAGHMLTDVGALALSLAHRLDRAAPGRHTQDLRLPALGDPGRAGERRGAVRHRGVGRDRGDPADPATRSRFGPGSFLAVAARGPGRQPGEPGPAARRRSTAASTPAGAYLHVMGDALGSVGALAAAAIIALTGWTLADPIVSIAPLPAHPRRRLAAAARKHRHPARVGAAVTSRSPRCSDRMLAVPGVSARARPARLDGDERHGGDERACRGARPRVPPGCARGNPDRDGRTRYRARHHPARGGRRVRGAGPTRDGRRPRHGCTPATATERARHGGTTRRSRYPSALAGT